MIFKLILLLLFTLGGRLYFAYDDITEFVRNNKTMLTAPEDLNHLINRADNRKLVLLGEASHGTSEFYTWRSELSKKLIKKGASFIVVEGDWLPCFYVNLYIKGRLDSTVSAEQLLIDSFQRWPHWMWANREVLDLVNWLHDYNKNLPPEKKVGFYGMDVYGQWQSLQELREIAGELDSEVFTELISVYELFRKYNYDEWQYAVSVARGGKSLAPDLERAAEMIYEKARSLEDEHELFRLNMKKNALVMQNSEKYYRYAVYDNVTAWNKRVDHMFEVTLSLLDFYGTDSRGIVWAHNTHIGDARATGMGQQNQYNIGQLARERFGEENVFNLGFATYSGQVLAGSSWGEPMQTMDIPNAVKNSIEDIFYSVSKKPFYLMFDQEARSIARFQRPIGNRAIGVSYDPRQDRRQFVPSIIPQRYDALIFIPYTNILDSLSKN